MDITVAVADSNSLYLREPLIEARDEDTGTEYVLCSVGRGLHLTVNLADGTSRRQVMSFEDLITAWAKALV